jgi:hypothetical protein
VIFGIDAPPVLTDDTVAAGAIEGDEEVADQLLRTLAASNDARK